jgi:hypothetical protein
LCELKRGTIRSGEGEVTAELYSAEAIGGATAFIFIVTGGLRVRARAVKPEN